MQSPQSATTPRKLTLLAIQLAETSKSAALRRRKEVYNCRGIWGPEIEGQFYFYLKVNFILFKAFACVPEILGT